MSTILVIARFSLLLNGVSMDVEAVSAEAGVCPRSSASAISLMPSTEGQAFCRGMAYEAGVVRYWELAKTKSDVGPPRLVGWQTRTPAKEFAKFIGRKGLTISFPDSALSFQFEPTGQAGRVP
jgi:hypothetical protein